MSCDPSIGCMPPQLYDFFDANGFMLEFMVATALFVHWLDRRPHAGARVLGSCCLLMFLSVAWRLLVPENTLTLIAQYVVYFLALAMLLKVCFTIRWTQAFFYTVAAGTLQHFAFRGARIIAVVPHMVFDAPEWTIAYIYPVALVPMYVIGYAAFARPLRGKNIENIGYGMILPLFAGMALCVSVFTNVFNAISPDIDSLAYTVFALFDLVNCMFMLALLREIVDRERAEEDTTVLQRMLEQQKSQLESSKETIDLINIKSHDLKKQLAAFGDRIDPEEIREMSELVEIYDSSVQTGNETLDILLKQRSLTCERHGIRFERMVDGRLLSFMRPADIYALFGNAIDNALEALERVTDDSRRYLSLGVRENRGMVAIRVENPYVGELEFVDGLPRTTKGDERYHGFGTRSIRMIVERYHGYCSIDADDGLFVLTILMPLSR